MIDFREVISDKKKRIPRQAATATPWQEGTHKFNDNSAGGNFTAIILTLAIVHVWKHPLAKPWMFLGLSLVVTEKSIFG